MGVEKDGARTRLPESASTVGVVFSHLILLNLQKTCTEPKIQVPWENIEQGPDSILMIRSTEPTRVRNIRIGKGAQVFLGTHP